MTMIKHCNLFLSQRMSRKAKMVYKDFRVQLMNSSLHCILSKEQKKNLCIYRVPYSYLNFSTL